MSDKFEPGKHLTNIKGKDYLEVKWRMVWFRSEHPDWGIVTSPLEINHAEQYAVFMANVLDANGKIVGTGTKFENRQGFADFIEKAETGAIGRALAVCGYGTQFSPEFEEGERLADSPVGGEKKQPPRASTSVGQAAQGKAGTGMATDKQIGLIKTIAKEVWGETEEAAQSYRGWMHAQTGQLRGSAEKGVSSSKQLTLKEASEIIGRLKVLSEERKAA